MALLTTLPQETLLQIINLLPRRDFLSLCISNRNLYNCIISKVYHTIHFLDSNVEVNPEHKWLFHEDHSTAVNHLSKVARTIQSSEFLRSLVSGVSFQWWIRIDDVAKPDVLRVLELIGKSLRTLHYAPAEWDFEIHELFPVTSVHMPYPVSRRAASTEDVHSLFSVPTLRHITLHHCKDVFKPWSHAFDDFQPPDDPSKRKTGTSYVEYLSIQDTASTEYQDLEEILIWPKALKALDCTLGDTEYLEYPLNPSKLVNILKPQRASLEQISVDFINRTFTSGTFGTSLRQFPKLKMIPMLRNFLARIAKDALYYVAGGSDEYNHMDWNMRVLYLAMPPALGELVLNVDIDVKWPREEDELPKPQFKEWIREVAVYKQELYPSLRRMVLWKSCKFAEFTPKEIYAQEKEMLEVLKISQDFKDVGVEFLYKVSDVAPDFQNPYSCFDRQ